ncbi:Acyl-protein synthetase, LuxE [Bernardetia litoralis DSM 6794]|uniref:Acyl-protein synthetase, LuxE n=1 Tax=Bernardetia litoralis (strain ATCC 23117 / DSM 6794 / NBRC 15988 / NCIMB 1366 / Fx l1 / Sio-4) TaxID=880071 RepID=I4AHY2_BERLS|nr:acyl-protein synthetase [Bernardetia litoralis]AFM03567.1 Acyl-protein synthetase, LuxE [Bernardetia litoralis DSM 6794]
MHQNFIANYKESISSLPKNDFKVFEKKALELFYFQSKYNPVYNEYIEKLNINSLEISSIYDIPFLPIRFFKSHNVQIEGVKTSQIFTSSGTTDQTQRSKHAISDLHFYEKSSQFIFEEIYKEYGKLSDFQIFALLPSYLERDGSSLIYMVDYFLKNAQANSNYFLYDYEKLKNELEKATLINPTKPILLLGVTFALLDFADFLNENYPNYSLPKTKQFEKNTIKNEIIVMETGGMKGRKKEMVREEVHQVLKNAFGVSAIDSEYGMTELLSQGYALKNIEEENTEIWFQTPSYLKVIIRDTNDPFDLKNIEYLDNNKNNSEIQSGAINVIDLANVESCAFIETQDLGKINQKGEFQVLGRFDYSDVRGCNLLVL